MREIKAIIRPERLCRKVETVVQFGAIRHMAHTGRPGDGKIFVIPVDDITRISTGEDGEKAI